MRAAFIPIGRRHNSSQAIQTFFDTGLPPSAVTGLAAQAIPAFCDRPAPSARGFFHEQMQQQRRGQEPCAGHPQACPGSPSGACPDQHAGPGGVQQINAIAQAPCPLPRCIKPASGWLPCGTGGQHAGKTGGGRQPLLPIEPTCAVGHGFHQAEQPRAGQPAGQTARNP